MATNGMHAATSPVSRFPGLILRFGSGLLGTLAHDVEKGFGVIVTSTERPGIDNKVYKSHSRQYTSFSNWDTYRTQIQLLSMLEPEVAIWLRVARHPCA